MGLSVKLYVNGNGPEGHFGGHWRLAARGSVCVLRLCGIAA